MKKSRIVLRMLVLTLLVLSFSCTLVHAAVPTITFVELDNKVFRHPLAITVNVAGNTTNPQLFINNTAYGAMTYSNGTYYYVWNPPYVAGGTEYTIQVRATGTGGSVSATKVIWVSAYTKEQRGIASASPYNIVERARSGQDCLGYALGVNGGMKLSDFKTISDYDTLMRRYGYYRVEDRNLAEIIVYGEHPNSYTYIIKHFAINTGGDSTRTKLGYDGEVVKLITGNPYNSMWGNEIAYYKYCPYLS